MRLARFVKKLSENGLCPNAPGETGKTSARSIALTGNQRAITGFK
jgi:hypothetical protein